MRNGFPSSCWGWWRRRAFWQALGVLAVLMRLELTEAPIPQRAVDVPAFYRQLRAEPGEGALVMLPIGDESKRSMYFQTIHGRPISEGKVARMPADAYDYIDANPLLSAWRYQEESICDFDLDQAIGDLRADGFRYVAAHKSGGIPNWLVDYAITKTPIYFDGRITVYELTDLQDNPLCESLNS